MKMLKNHLFRVLNFIQFPKFHTFANKVQTLFYISIMEKYFQNTNNQKGKRKESDDIVEVEPSRPSGTSSTRNKKYKKERNDWDPKWPQTYPWLERREKEEGKPFMYCIWCEEGKANNIFTKGCNK